MTSVPAGSYAVSAKTVIVQSGGSGGDDDDDDDGGSANAEVRCTLDAGGANADYAETDSPRAAVSTQVLTSFASSGTVVLRCRRLTSGTTAVARQTKIVVFAVGTVTRTAVGG